jgi:hypothetical protein
MSYRDLVQNFAIVTYFVFNLQRRKVLQTVNFNTRIRFPAVAHNGFYNRPISSQRRYYGFTNRSMRHKSLAIIIIITLASLHYRWCVYMLFLVLFAYFSLRFVFLVLRSFSMCVFLVLRFVMLIDNTHAFVSSYGHTSGWFGYLRFNACWQ